MAANFKDADAIKPPDSLFKEYLDSTLYPSNPFKRPMDYYESQPKVSDLRAELAELAPNGRDIGKALKADKSVYDPRTLHICKLVSLIHQHKHKPARNFYRVNRFLKMQLAERANRCDVEVVWRISEDNSQVGLARVIRKQGKLLAGRQEYTRFHDVQPTWKPIPLKDKDGHSQLLLDRHRLFDVRFGMVYQVYYLDAEGIRRCGLAVGLTIGGRLVMIDPSPQQATAVAEELFAEHYASLSGLNS